MHGCLPGIAAVDEDRRVHINAKFFQGVQFLQREYRERQLNGGSRVEILQRVESVIVIGQSGIVPYVAVDLCIDELVPVNFRVSNNVLKQAVPVVAQ